MFFWFVCYSFHNVTYSQLEKQFSEKNSSYIALQERVKDLEDENNNLKYKLAETNAEIIRKEQEIRKQTSSTTADIETSINDLSSFVVRNVPLHWQPNITLIGVVITGVFAAYSAVRDIFRKKKSEGESEMLKKNLNELMEELKHLKK